MRLPIPEAEHQALFDEVTDDYNTLESNLNDLINFLELSTQFYSMYDEVTEIYDSHVYVEV